MAPRCVVVVGDGLLEYARSVVDARDRLPRRTVAGIDDTGKPAVIVVLYDGCYAVNVELTRLSIDFDQSVLKGRGVSADRDRLAIAKRGARREVEEDRAIRIDRTCSAAGQSGRGAK